MRWGFIEGLKSVLLCQKVAALMGKTSSLYNVSFYPRFDIFGVKMTQIN